MGFYKKLKIDAEDGNRDAMHIAADVYRANGNLRMARCYYERLNLKKEIEEVMQLLKLEDDEDIWGD